jgi:hypothetical protein
MHQRYAYKILVGKSGRKRPLGRIILKWALKIQGGSVWTGFIWLEIGTRALVNMV